MLDVADIRRRVRLAIERARRDAAARREAADQAAREYERFLRRVAEPVARTVVAALKAEGYLFHLATPAGGLRLESERAREDFIEIVLDTSRTPVVLGRASYRRGRDVVATERPLREGAAVADLTAEDVLQFLLEAIGPFVER